MALAHKLGRLIIPKRADLPLARLKKAVASGCLLRSIFNSFAYPLHARFPAGVFISGCQAARAPKDMQQTQPQRNPCPGAAVRMADGLGQPATRYQKDKECSDGYPATHCCHSAAPAGRFSAG